MLSVIFLFGFLIGPSLAEPSEIDWSQLIINSIRLFKDYLKIVSEAIPQPEDAGKNITEILDNHNYPWETHNVVTEDGYILKMFRIPYGRTDTLKSNKPVVFLMHGLLSSAVDFVNMGPGKSLGLILADEGYDVWLGNSRGNLFSRAHITMDPDKNSSFWKFSWHEQGIYDLPASIDYILKHTGVSNLTYIGHSQGTTDYFVMGSEKPEYNEKINLMVALAPIAFMQNMTSPVPRWMAKNIYVMELIFKDVLQIHEFPYIDWITLIGQVFCNDQSKVQALCSGVLELVVGKDSHQLNTTLFPVFLTSTPSGCSVDQMVHYGQLINSGYFRQFDYGAVTNLDKYDSFTPPEYNLSAITAPIALYHAENDYMSAECNVAQLSEKLENIVDNQLIKEFNHLDFLWAGTADTKVYNKVLDVIKKYI